MRYMILLMGFLFVLTVVVVAACANEKTEAKEATTEPRVIAEPEQPFIYDEYTEQCCACDDLAQNGPEKIIEHVDRPETEVSQDRMIEEVEMLWTMYFDDDNVKASDPRRKRFGELAEYLVDAVIMYQDAPTDIGGQLPRHKNDHLMIAYTAAKESSVTPDAINDGKKGKGEVCLMQLHGKALAGYPAEKVRNNAKLCLLLGTRWLTSQIPQCKQEGSGVYGEQFVWETSDWTGPLSVYAGGPKAIRKNGQCIHFTKMIERVNAVRMFRTRIDYAMEMTEE